MASERRPPSGTPGALMWDMRFAANRLLPQMYRDMAADQAKYPDLARVAGNAEPDLWEEDPTRALLVVMRRAVKNLSPKDAPPNFAKDCTWQHVGLLLYFGSEIYSSLHEYDDYLARLETDSQYHWSESKRD